MKGICYVLKSICSQRKSKQKLNLGLDFEDVIESFVRIGYILEPLMPMADLCVELTCGILDDLMLQTPAPRFIVLLVVVCM